MKAYQTQDIAEGRHKAEAEREHNEPTVLRAFVRAFDVDCCCIRVSLVGDERPAYLYADRLGIARAFTCKREPRTVGSADVFVMTAATALSVLR